MLSKHGLYEINIKTLTVSQMSYFNRLLNVVLGQFPLELHDRLCPNETTDPESS